jgi:hypothetical protein
MRDYKKTVSDLRNFNANYESNKLTNDAADAIEELLAKVPRWISVEERLPDHRKRVLAIYANGVISTGRVFHNGFPEAYDGFDENGDFKVVPVTHWMPLPEPPKGVE